MAIYLHTDTEQTEQRVTVAAESGVKVYGNSSYYSCNFSAGVKCYQNKNFPKCITDDKLLQDALPYKTLIGFSLPRNLKS